MAKEKELIRSVSSTIIFCCSGGVDVGELSDRTARRLSSEGRGRLFSLERMKGDTDDIVENARSANKILVIDGCFKDCLRKSLEKVGINEFSYLRVTDVGFEKGNTPVTEENVCRILEEAELLLDKKKRESK